MDILDKIATPQQSSVDLNSFVLPSTEASIPPRSAQRNRAATTAILSNDPSKLIDNYNLMMNESGGSAIQQGLQKQVVEDTTQLDTKGLISVLSNASVPLEKKQEAVKNFRTSKFLSDQSNTLYSNSLSAESKGENVEQETSRITLADAIGEMAQARVAIQGLVNAHAASFGNNSLTRDTAELAEAWVMPFGNSIATMKMSQAIKKELGENPTLWDAVKAFVKPGTATQDIVKRLEQLPPEKQVAFAQTVLKVIKENSGILFSSDNQFEQFDKATTIFNEGGYGDFPKFLDNISPLLDVLGLGAGVRGLRKVPKTAQEATKVADTIPGTTKTAEASLDVPAYQRRGMEAPLTSPKIEVPDAPVVENVGNTPATSTLLGGSGKRTTTAEPTKPVAALFQKKTGTGVYTINADGTIDEIKRIEVNAPVRVEHPASPVSIVNQTNPEKARNLHEVILASEGDEAAQALAGVNKEQAIVNNIMPQVATESGAVISKPVDIEQNVRKTFQVPEELVELVNNTGAIYYTRGEKAAARANVVHDFQNASGLTINDAMSSFALDGGKIKISAVYGLDTGGFLRAEDAYRQAQLALAKYGIRDDEITILQKKGLDHVPLDVNNVPPGDGNYFVRIDTNHNIDPTDVGAFEALDVKRNLFDRTPTLVSNDKGSLTRNLLDAGSTLHPTITGAASVATDATSRFEKFMLSMLDEYAKEWRKLPKDRQNKVDEYLKEANYNEIAFDITDLKARGFSDQEITTIGKWRNYWDAQFYLENYDVVRTLNSQGYELFKNKNVEFYAKPISKNQNLGVLYDPALDSIVVHTKSQGDDLYNTGGTYAHLRRPVDINGVTIEYMIVRNTPSEYLRKFRDSDRVLNYREGYYQLAYNAPRFVDEAVRDSSGKLLYWKSIAVAGDTEEATQFAKRMATGKGKSFELDFRVRGDERALQKGSDSWWDVNSAFGRIAQRHRGKLLEDGSGLNHLGDGGYIVDPVEAGIRAARSISGRTVTRPMLEASKTRAISQYAKYFPTDDFGAPRWPRNVSEIGAKGDHTSKGVADARTTYEYINYLENGYINSVDTTVKAMMNALADQLGKVGLTKAERAVNRVADTGPVSLAKNATFTAYLAANPLRQWIVQTHQVVRTWAYNPKGWATGSIIKYLGEYGAVKAGLKGETEFSKFIDASGLLDSVDKQNLVRGALLSAADASNPVSKYAGAPFRLTRRVGFDVGEQGNLMGHAAAVYDKFKRDGKNLKDLHVRDEAYSEIRAISYDMNFAGDLAYNQTTPAMILQFMQVPHKAILQMTNRKIDRATTFRMVSADLIMWGTPGAMIAEALGYDILPENPVAREAVLWGLESMVWNQFFKEIAGDQTDIDFSSLAPYDMTGWAEFFRRVREEGMDSVIVNSPAGQLFLKDTGQARTAVKSMLRYMNVIEDSDTTPTEFTNVMNEVAKIASGWNNWQKAKLMLETTKKLDKYGNTIDDSVTKLESWAQLLGFTTASTRDYYRISNEVNRDSKAYREDVLKSYKDIMNMYATNLGIPSSDPRFITQVSGTLLKIYGDDPQALDIINRQFMNDIQKDQQLLRQMMSRSGIPDVAGVRNKILQAPIEEEQKQQLLNRMKDIQNAREYLKRQNEKETN